jgi:hypothetical protein
MNLLLLSSSRTPAGYFTDYLAEIRAFSARVRRALFVPFAAVSLRWDDYAKKVSAAIGLPLQAKRSSSPEILMVVTWWWSAAGIRSSFCASAACAAFLRPSAKK